MPEGKTAEVSAWLVMLVIGLILRPVFDPPAPHDLVNGAEEQAAVVMQERLPRGSLVMAGAPGGVWAARMEFQDANAYSAVILSQTQALRIMRSPFGRLRAG